MNTTDVFIVCSPLSPRFHSPPAGFGASEGRHAHWLYIRLTYMDKTTAINTERNRFGAWSHVSSSFRVRGRTSSFGTAVTAAGATMRSTPTPSADGMDMGGYALMADQRDQREVPNSPRPQHTTDRPSPLRSPLNSPLRALRSLGAATSSQGSSFSAPASPLSALNSSAKMKRQSVAAVSATATVALGTTPCSPLRTAVSPARVAVQDPVQIPVPRMEQGSQVRQARPSHLRSRLRALAPKMISAALEPAVADNADDVQGPYSAGVTPPRHRAPILQRTNSAQLPSSGTNDAVAPAEQLDRLDGTAEQPVPCNISTWLQRQGEQALRYAPPCFSPQSVSSGLGLSTSAEGPAEYVSINSSAAAMGATHASANHESLAAGDNASDTSSAIPPLCRRDSGVAGVGHTAHAAHIQGSGTQDVPSAVQEVDEASELAVFLVDADELDEGERKDALSANVGKVDANDRGLDTTTPCFTSALAPSAKRRVFFDPVIIGRELRRDLEQMMAPCLGSEMRAHLQNNVVQLQHELDVAAARCQSRASHASTTTLNSSGAVEEGAWDRDAELYDDGDVFSSGSDCEDDSDEEGRHESNHDPCATSSFDVGTAAPSSSGKRRVVTSTVMRPALEGREWKDGIASSSGSARSGQSDTDSDGSRGRDEDGYHSDIEQMAEVRLQQATATLSVA